MLFRSGGLILFHEKTNIDKSIFSTEVIDFYSWPEWKMGYFQSHVRVQVTLQNGVIRNLVPRQGLEISENRAPYLITKNGISVFHATPVLLAGQVATAIDQYTHERQALGPEESPVSAREYGPLDVTVYAALGKSRNLKGLLLPGLSLEGDLTPLVRGEQREIKINLPVGWSGDHSMTLTYEDLETRHSFHLVDPASTRLQIFVDVPKLHWSIEFQGEVPEILNSNSNYRISRVKQLKRIVVHGLGNYIPRVLFRQNKAQTVISGKPRNQDSLYDLQVVQDANIEVEATVIININGKEVVLATFLSRPATPAKRKLTTLTDLSQLASAAVQLGVISESDWQSFEADRHANSAMIRKSLRDRRREW